MPKRKKKSWNQRFNIKPVSANRMYFRNKQLTKDYRLFREQVYEDVADRSKWPFEDGEHLTFVVMVGFSSKLADVDNVIKPLLDTWQLMFEFNDKYVYKVIIEKEIVKKGEEYFEVTVTNYGD